jgi:oleandomycin transport system ATP-binding protein
MVTVSITDRSALGQAVRRLDDEDIAIDDLSLRRPSLDEVFLAVTGHVAEEDEDALEDKHERERRTA